MAFGLKSRAQKNRELVEATADAVLEKAALGRMMVPAGAAVAVTPVLARDLMNRPNSAQSLARQASTFTGSFGPGLPFQISPIDALGPNGRPDPRKKNYPVSINNQLTNFCANWPLLRSAATEVDIVSRCISIVCADIGSKNWSFAVTAQEVQAVMERDDVVESVAAKTARAAHADEIASLTDFWENPYPQSDRGFREWITEFNWMSLVFDGVPVHAAFNLGGKCIGFDVIDASTIKILLNDLGDFPRPPDPAFQQVLYGFVRGEWIATPNSGDPMFIGGEFGITERDMLSYFVLNRNTLTFPYGFSPVEQALAVVRLYTQRQRWLIDEYEHGTQANVYMITKDADEVSLENQPAWETLLNDYLEGQTSNRHRTKLTPFTPVFSPQIDERYKADYDEGLRKWVSSFFGVAPSQVGVLPRSGLGSGKGAQEGEQDNAETVSSKPRQQFIEESINTLGRRHLGQSKAVTFVLSDDKGAEEDVEIAKAGESFVSSALMSRNEWRIDHGLPASSVPEADVLMITTAAGTTPLVGMLEFDSGGNPLGLKPTGGTNGVQTDGTDPSADQRVRSGSDSQKEVPQGQGQGEGEVSTGSGKATKARLNNRTATNVGEELVAFDRYVKRLNQSGKWRNFDFDFVDDEVAEKLNQQGYFVAKGAAPDTDAWISEIVKAGLAPRPKSPPHPKHAAITATAKRHEAAVLAALTAVGIRKAVTVARSGVTATSAVANNVTLGDKLGAVLKTLHDDAGAQAGTVPQNMADLLDQRGYTLAEIDRTTTKRLSDTLEAGIAKGDSPSAIADAMNATLNDPARASSIALTESSRAYSAVAVDGFQTAGATGWDWNAEGSACDDCASLEASNPMDFSDPVPPEHPNCMCWPSAVGQ